MDVGRPRMEIHPPALRSRTTLVARRSVLAALVLATPAMAACSALPGLARQGPDPLVALADAAHADAGLAASILAADPSVRDRVEPLRAARSAHAAALDTALGRTGPTPATSTPATSSPATSTPTAPTPATPTPVDDGAAIKRLQSAVAASAASAGDAALVLPATTVGLVASIAACCAAYATTL